MRPTSLALAIGALSLPLALQAAPPLAVDAAAIDAVFAQHTASTPGCAVGVVRDGQLLHAKGYGLADLSFGVPITPRTVFDIGSVSKQFTALALLWLVHDGQLRLDDTVQQHLPELAASLPQPITLRQMLQHTAGLPDYPLMMVLAGDAEENVTGDEDALRVIRAGVPLNFAPGTEFSYSNSGYFLAGQVVEKVSGQKLDAFLKARLFQPLGMAATHIRTDHTQVVPQRANAYAPRPGGWALSFSNWNQAGDGAVQSSVDDLARWEAELMDPKVVPAPVLTWMRTPGVLANGKTTTYGMGWMTDPYRGLTRTHHGGVWAGYRAMTLRFPTERTAIALTCNRADADTADLAQKVADVVLAGAFPTPRDPLPSNPTVPAAELERLHGAYLRSDGVALARIDPGSSPGTLTINQGGGPAPLTVLDATELRTRQGSRLRWADDRQSFELVNARDDARVRYQRVALGPLSAAQRQALIGRYAHAGLAAQWQVQAGEGEAFVLKGKGLDDGLPLQPINAQLLRSPMGLVHIQRDAQGRVASLRLANDRLRHLVMTRL
ncbi:MAG: serine hydrolase [Inhella sp.]|uniref:serine hydrolase domain-containing protein n=1 Tax=Inhella sp. TaxID=1921806 RepID=UPI0022C6E27F|nr:serine hydrolase domain-containing protein [Inhella sp.]MCZ8236076.1 serine hydrolase [Inhella sp.]